MIIRVGNFDCTEVWDGVFYKKLSHYPQVTDWEIRTIIEFMDYEHKYGRECTIECENKELLSLIQSKIENRDKYINTTRPKLLTECTACPYRKGCVTDYVCHTTSVENAVKIFESGKLLSALNARKVPVEELMSENRNAANDPADYFEYIMFAWGNCQAGDRLVMERALDRFPTEEDLSEHFQPGVRFYFKYDQLLKHPGAICDGFLPMKVKDEIILRDWIYKIVIPTQLKNKLEKYIPDDLQDMIIYMENDCKDIWDWSEKVYKAIEKSGIVDNISVNTRSSIKITGTKTIYFDPLDIEGAPHDADMVFITHEHYDHFSPQDIKKILKSDTQIIVPSTMFDIVRENHFSMQNFQGILPSQIENYEGVKYQGIAAYNIDKPFHPKDNNWLGYMVELDGIIYYAMGDTDVIPEAMLVDADVIFVPIGGKYTMDVTEAAAFINKKQPGLVVPIHYGNSEVGESFTGMLRTGIEVELFW